ncbi:uncharacterized protein JCM6883_006430 [Sporobolomyces salmoneus]|uniref:uncharacterized protein n=1 Tax=Sporobolomyces salmoneus TaxID=183962 RepID=UPI00317E4C20
MEDSWTSWDGSLVSLHSSMAASTRPSSPSLSLSVESLRRESISPPPPAAIRTDTAPYRSSYRYLTPPAINTRPPSPQSDPAPPASSLAPHPLASILLSDLSPLASPAPSNSSFPRSASHSRINSAAASPNSSSRPGRGRTRTRRGTSVSSTASNDGSAPTDEESGTSSAEENHDHQGGGLVMPSLTLHDDRPHRNSITSNSRSREQPREGHIEGRKVNLLVLGKTAEDRQTLTALLANDEDLKRQESDSSFDLSYSFVSSIRSHHVRSSSEKSEPTSQGLFSQSGACGSGITLSHPPNDESKTDELLEDLKRPLEQLEAKLERSFPSTGSLSNLVSASGVGYFDASLFLFSSPPLPCEIAFAKSVSHLLPILPILILPPSPTSKPQKTSALSNAVVQQLDSAGVRWLSIEAFDRRESRSPTRKGCTKSSDICGGPISMLPHDLFVQHPPAHYASSSSTNRETPTNSFPSPNSEPTSLTTSQELPPLSPTFTTASSSYRSSSSRASSTRSLSPSSTNGRNTANLHHLTLLDLHRLRRVLHSNSGPERVRRARAETFLEWREVEVAARGVEPVEIEFLPKEWEEKAVECEGTGKGGRRGLDFSKRVAERRKALGRPSSTPDEPETRRIVPDEEEDDGDVLDMKEDDHRRPSVSSAQDPTTPKPSFRHLPSTFAPLSTPTPTSSSSSSNESSSSSNRTSSSSARSPSPSYFPPFPAAPLSASIVSLPSTASDLTDSSKSSTASIVLLRTCDPFHLPSLLHLVGLNLRLALFRSDVPRGDTRSLKETEQEEEEKRSSSSSRSSSAKTNSNTNGWWKTFAVFSVVFAAGVVAGIQVVEHFDHSAG